MLIFASSPLQAGQVRITAASDLQYAMKEIISAYKKKNPEDKVSAVFGSSGKAFSQIENGAPYDMFFSADISYPEKLKTSGSAISEPKPYAIGRMTVWVTKSSGLDAKKGIRLLSDPKVRKIAMANPEHAPYGRIAREVMEHYKVYDNIKNRIVLGENIQQTAQFVQTGAADVGMIAYSLALAPVLAKEGNYYLIPENIHKPILQGYVLLKPASGNRTAKKFELFIGSAEARSIFKRYGFTLPNE
ncbi:molybdate ABC transporter substrate-binding protein [Chlorobium sp.]|uniref:molybdate ABC transporter substrate-binding protein n=1 Tax=Chlorobium sp. TaxID=1095 RepID=UPI0025C4E83F|nr:molybdate ABC transporter substrate-binding protein [Chlorobium sp.]